MIRLVTAAEALALDRRLGEAWSLSPLLLMEAAAEGVWRRLEPRLGPVGAAGGAPLVALAGGGSNGGDALAILRKARFAGRGGLAAILATEEPGPALRAQLGMLRAMGVSLLSWKEERAEALRLLAGAGILLDGIAGAGLRGALAGPPLELARAAAEAAAVSGAPVAAVDLPSGLRDEGEPGDFVLPATWTFVIEPRKASLSHPATRLLAGEIIPVPGVFPPDAAFEPIASLLEEGDLAGLLPPSSRAAHKGERGRLAVFAGSSGYAGAALLAIRGAAASGAGYLSWHCDGELLPGFAAGSAALAGGPAGVVIRDLALPAGADALLAGPGWGSSPDRASLLRALLEAGKPLVLDAEALRLLPGLGDPAPARRAPLVLTPHPGEFAALTGLGAERFLASPVAPLRAAAARLGAVIVLKSQVTWLAGPGGELAVWEGLEPSLGVAGSGDVLAGLLGGLLARGAPAWDAARAAVIAHGLAGRAARTRLGFYPAEEIAREAGRLLGAFPDVR